MTGGLHVKQRDKVYDRRAAVIPRHAEVITDVVDCPISTRPGGEKLAVTRTIRDDPLAEMHARKQIDNAQLVAGRMWQAHHENSAIGLAAIDPTKEAVDGGRFPEPVTDRQMKASDRLKEADQVLGDSGSELIRAILGERLTVPQYGMRLGMTTAREFDFVSRRFRECLDDLAKLWGLA